MAVVCLVGAGPRGTALLERLTVNAPEVLGEEPLVVHVLDPFPAGAGRIWRVEQPRLLWMNSVADDVALFPDEASVIRGPVVPAATLAEWVESHREELSADPETAEELDGFTAHSFASRALQGRFLRWSFQRVVDNAPEGVTVQVHQVRALDVTEGLDGRQLVHLEGTDTPLAADAVVLAQGHPETSPGPREWDLARVAEAHGLVHVPPGYTADLDPNVVPGRERVLVSGLGLAFVDWVVLLCETRGGSFGRGADGVLVYTPSGREPELVAGSRRGVPHHAKLAYVLQGERPPLPKHLTPAAFAGDGLLDFHRDVWPLASKELAGAHYHELFTAHRERTTMDWLDFCAEFDALDWGSRELDALVAAAVPEHDDVLDLRALDRVLQGEVFTDTEAAHERVLSHIRADLARRADPAHSADAAVFLALLSVYGVIAELVRTGRLSEQSAVRDVEGWLHGFFSSVASGPPPQRLEQVLAVAEAGVLRFLGPDVRFGADETTGSFFATSERTGDTVHARVLVDARLPTAAVADTTDPLLRALHARGEVVEPRVDGVPAGKLVVDAANRLVTTDGAVHDARYAVGPWVAGGAWASAFPRPGINAGFFRQNDAIARQLLEAHSASRAGKEVLPQAS